MVNFVTVSRLTLSNPKVRFPLMSVGVTNNIESKNSSTRLAIEWVGDETKYEVLNGEIVPKEDETLLAEAWVVLRKQRDQLLRAYVDTMNPIMWESLSEETKRRYRDYRQQLLDLPKNTSDPRNPAWPDKPF